MENSNNNKKSSIKPILITVVFIAVLAVCSYMLISGFLGKKDSSVRNEEISNRADEVLKDGGSLIVFVPDIENTRDISSEDMESAKLLVRSRLDMKGYPEATVEVDASNKIIVAVPGSSVSQEFAEELSAIGKLEFLDADGNVIMDGTSKYITNAKPMYDQTTEFGEKQFYIELSFTKEGREKFKEATQVATAAVGDKQYISIALDGIVQMSPRVNEVIDSESCIITGNYTQSDAENVSNLINSAKLPFTLTVTEVRTVSPQH